MPHERPDPAADLPADDQLLAFADSILAQSAAETHEPAPETRAYLGFLLRESRYGIPVVCCREIVRVGPIARIPEAPSEVLGIFNLRGRMVPVIELGRRLGLASAPVTACSRLVVVEAKGRIFGLMVDRVLGISKIAIADIERDGAWPDVLAGKVKVDGQVLSLFDPDRILLTARGGKP